MLGTWGCWNGGTGPGWGPGCPYDPDETDVACDPNAGWLWNWRVRALTFFCREAISVAMSFSCAFIIFALAFLAFRRSFFSFRLDSSVRTSNKNSSTGSGASSSHRDRTSTCWSRSSSAQPFSNWRITSFGIAVFFIPPRWAVLRASRWSRWRYSVAVSFTSWMLDLNWVYISKPSHTSP